jgi:hypothetical protein
MPLITRRSSYIGREIWIAFPINDDWYLMRRDDMLQLAEADGLAQTAPWKEGGAYSRPRPSAAVIAQCAPYRFAPITAVAADAASEEDGTVTR